LAWFWGVLVFAVINNILGAILEYMFKPSMNCSIKFKRFLRSFVYKGLISVPVMVLFAFDYTKPCLELKNSMLISFSNDYMSSNRLTPSNRPTPSNEFTSLNDFIFANEFVFGVVLIQFPIMIFVFINIINEFSKPEPNKNYQLVTGSIEGQSICKKIFRVILLICKKIIRVILLSILIFYIQTLFFIYFFLLVTDIVHLLGVFNILLSFFTICDIP
jgi:hypothetical protein